MKLVELKCPCCNARLDIEENMHSVRCEYCDTTFIIENGELAGKAPDHKAPKPEDRVELAQDPTAPEKAEGKPAPRKTWLWVLGWIFMFPVPLTILMLRNETLDKKLRIAIIVVAWIVYLCLGLYGGAG